MDVGRAIGVLDSGVGGLTVLKSLINALPNENFLYLGDTARTPYGSRDEAEVRAFVFEMLDWLAEQGVKLVVIACNTITVLGVDTLKKNYPFEIVGMSKGEELVLAASKNKKIGVMATNFTISTGAHKKAIQAMDPTAEVFGQPCQKWVSLVEQEAFESDELKAAINEYTEPLKKAEVDTVILSCTHFPFLKDDVAEAMGKDVTVLNPAEATAVNAKEALAQQNLLTGEGKGHVKVCCTADLERVIRLAERMIDTTDAEFAQVTI